MDYRKVLAMANAARDKASEAGDELAAIESQIRELQEKAEAVRERCSNLKSQEGICLRMIAEAVAGSDGNGETGEAKG